MCGIAGIVGPAARAPGAAAVLAAMLESLRHRGPDDVHQVRAGDALLGARRLSIVDLAGGRQPFASERGDVVACLNGELYDHDALRRDLEARGHRFRTRADTEVLLRLYLEEGVRALDRLEGMYALGVFDQRQDLLLLARDRMGEKPLCYASDGPSLRFASEWRGLAAGLDRPLGLDPDAVALYLQHRFVPSPRTLVRGVFRLAPGERLLWRAGRVDVRRYWTLPAPPRAPGPGRAVPADAVRRVRSLLDRAVESRLGADVPVGVFLSGGIDSGALAAIAARRGPIETFTLRPEASDFDEGRVAARAARRAGATHHEVRVGAAELDRAYDAVFDAIDEPIGDASLVPTWLLARAARQHVKVVLSGEGADELFGGYPTYPGARLAPRLARGPLRATLRLALCAAGGGAFGNVATPWLVRRLLEGAPLGWLERHLAWTGAFSAVDQHALWRPEARPALVGEDLLSVAAEAARPAVGTGDVVDALLRVDLRLALPDALLAKVDRATMHAGLEARAPFLERRLVETAAAMPARWKVRGIATKVVLKRALAGLLPREALARRKRGFQVPVSRAFAAGLGDRLRDRLGPRGPAADLFSADLPLRLLDAHRRGRADHGRRLYALLALLEWIDRWLAPPRCRAAPPAHQSAAPLRAPRPGARAAPSPPITVVSARSTVSTGTGRSPAA